MKICLESAEGGHFEEMMNLMDAFEGHEILIVTNKTEATLNLPFKTNYAYRPNKFLMNSGLFGQIICVIINFIIIFKFLVKERPNLIISTGSGATIPIFYLSKIMFINTIFIESMARINDISLTGKIVYPVSGVFLVQWESLLPKYKKAKFWGRII